MMWGYGNDPVAWMWMGLLMVVFWGAVAALVVYAVRSFRPGSGGDSAMDTLRRRLAAGEISQEEFEKTKRLLQS